jgi:hypothetical protein
MAGMPYNTLPQYPQDKSWSDTPYASVWMQIRMDRRTTVHPEKISRRLDSGIYSHGRCLLQWKPWYLYLGHWWQGQASVGSPFHLLVSLSVCSIGRAAAHSHPRKKRNASVEARNFPFQRCWVFQECLVSRCTVYVDRGLRLRVQRICSFGAVYWHGDTSSITELPNG